MKFNNVDHRKQFLEEEIERLRLLLVSLYKEKDIVLEQIGDQRKGKSVVYSETNKKKTELNGIEDILKQTSIQLKKANKDFYKLTDNQRIKINKLTNEINNKLSDIENYNKIVLIDKDKENRKIKSVLNDKRKELSILEGQIIHMKQSMDEFDKFTTKESQRLEEQRTYQEEIKKSLTKKEHKLNLKEKRLNALLLEIKKKQNE